MMAIREMLIFSKQISQKKLAIWAQKHTSNFVDGKITVFLGLIFNTKNRTIFKPIFSLKNRVSSQKIVCNTKFSPSPMSKMISFPLFHFTDGATALSKMLTSETCFIQFANTKHYG